MHTSALYVVAWCLAAAMAHAAVEEPYLAPERVPDGVAILPAPPATGSAAARADEAMFTLTRGLRGTLRWQIAIDDVTNSPLDRYACALDLHLSAAAAPAVFRVLDRADTGSMVDAVKQHYHTRRPFIGRRGGLCEARTAHLVENPDYPSGHAANGWLEALILAELVPDRATALLARGRAYGESRVICGSHTPSAVVAGWMSGSVIYAALNAEPEFRRDLEAARHEMAAVRPDAARPDARRCTDERAALGRRAW